MGMKKMDEDFKILRDKPLLKVSDNIYCPLHLNFFIDKIYYGLIWDFYYSSSINKVFDKFQDYLQRLGTIVEKEIFYKHIDKCFPNRFIKKVNGSQYTSIEYSDYYIRDGKKIFVFEFKNSIVKSSIKYAHSFDDIEKEIKTKLYYDSNSRQDKGVKQLKKVILKIKHNKLDFDKYDGTLLGKLQIYPIIVYTDSFFSIDGISHLVNGLFRNEINSDAECFDLKIKDLILISMESLFDIISLIEKREYTFREICDIYFDKQKKQEKRGMKPTNENHIKKRFRGFDNTMAQILKTSKPSNEFIDLLIGALKN
jgi:hypothetical protein